MHGGAAPQVQRTARERIAALVDPALDALARAIASDDANAAVRAARDILDRAGLAPRHSVELAFGTDPFAAIDAAVQEANRR